LPTQFAPELKVEAVKPGGQHRAARRTIWPVHVANPDSTDSTDSTLRAVRQESDRPGSQEVVKGRELSAAGAGGPCACQHAT